MIGRLAASAFLGGALLFAAPLSARADDARGAIVMSTSPDAVSAAKPLAREVYKDEALRPTIDDATARVLAGEAPPEGSPPKLLELRDLRASALSAGSEAASRKLLAAIGADRKARLVVTVSMEGGRPRAKVLRVETSSYEGIEIGATTETAPSGETIFHWPGAADALRKLLPADGPRASASSAGPLDKPLPAAPKPAPSRSIWSSPWFWAVLGGVVAAGAGTFAIVKTTKADEPTVHIVGRVAP
jgi:hypothetical protein